MAQTWLGRSTLTPRSRYGESLCPGAGFEVFGLREIASMPIRFISVTTGWRPISILSLFNRLGCGHVFDEPAEEDEKKPH